MTLYFLPMGLMILKSINKLHVLTKIGGKTPSHAGELDLGYELGMGEKRRNLPRVNSCIASVMHGELT